MIRRKLSLVLAVALSLIVAVLLFNLGLTPTLSAQPLQPANTLTVGVDCPTIQACIDLLPKNNTWHSVIVPAGVYTEFVTIDGPTAFRMELVGAGRDRTIIRAPAAGRAVMEVRDIDHFKAHGLRLTGASGSLLGGGLMISSTTGVDLWDMRFDNNRAAYGGGIYLYDSLTNLDHVEVISNTAIGSGGGWYSDGPLNSYNNHNYVWASLFANNTAPDAQYRSARAYQSAVEQVTFVNYPTTAPQAAILTSDALYIRVCNTLIVSHTIGVRSLTAEGINGCGVLYSAVTTPWQGVYHDTGSGVIASAVQFVDPAHDNYHLACSAATPGCVSASDFSTTAPWKNLRGDIDGEARPYPYNTSDAKYDAGYDEWLAYPEVRITYPAAGALLTSTSILVSGVISPQGALVKSIDLTLDGGATWQPLSSTLQGEARHWIYTDTRALDGVTLALQARQQNTLNNPPQYSTVITTLVDNVLPEAAISDPVLGQVIRSHVYTVTGTAADGFGVSRLEISLDKGSTYFDATPGSNWEWPWIIPDEDGASHLLRTRVTDHAGNVRADPATLAVFVDNVPPVIQFNNVPTTGVTSILSDTFTVLGSSSGALSTTLTLNGGEAIPVDVVDHTFTQTLTALVTGTYTLRGLALDAGGNTAAVTATLVVTPYAPIPRHVFLPLVFRTFDPLRDRYEIDDTVTEARAITTDGVPQRHNFYPANDVDWVGFDATPGTYIINTGNLAANTDTVLRLYAGGGVTLLAQNDDCSPTTRASCLTWMVVTSSTLYVQITPYDANSIGPDHWYDLAIVKQ